MKRIFNILLIIVVVVFALFGFTFVYSRSWKHALFVKPLYRLNTDEKVIALTFDDGPSNVRTPALLDLLKTYNVYATFFMLGQHIQEYPVIAQRVLDEGHLIGNHSYDHARLIFRSPRFIKKEVLKTDSLIRELGQDETVYMRPPNTSKYLALPLILSSMDKILVTGTYDPPSEYKSPYSAEAVAGEVIQNVRPGSIVYLHDGIARDEEAFIESVELIIKVLKQQGYSFVKLDQIVYQGDTDSSTRFREEEVVFRNDLDGATLSGTLTLPEGEHTFPVAVLISGSGQQDRDETVYGHKPFRALAEFLTQHRIGVLRYDDRGVGGSEGDVWSATLELQASDAYAAIQYLKSRKEVDPECIGIIGHSLGAMQGTILAGQYPDIAFLVMLGGIGIPFTENHIMADRRTNELSGEPIEIIDAGSKLLDAIFEVTVSTDMDEDYQTTRNRLQQIVQEWRSSLSGIAKAEIDSFTEANPDFWIKQFAEEYATPLYISCAKYVPSDYLTRIQCPVLSLIGEKDIQVTPENSDAIDMALKEAGNENYQVSILKDINHLMQKCETGMVSEYEQLEEDFNPEVMNMIVEWLHENINNYRYH